MPTAAERRALTFLAAIAALGGGARWHATRQLDAELAPATNLADAGDTSPADRALAAQLAAVDSARSSARPSRSRARRRRNARPAIDAPSEAALEASSDAARPPTPERGGRRGASRPPAIRGPSPDEPLDVNRASSAELERLPRVGPALARRIVAWRSQHGPFESIDALRHVPGIGVTTSAVLAPLVTFSSGSRP